MFLSDVDILGAVKKGETATKTATITTNGVAASTIEGKEGTFQSASCGSTGTGI